MIITSVPTRAKIKIAGTILSVPLEYHNSIGLAHALGLKTLDLMLLAYADDLRKWGHEIETFVTGDMDILYNSEKIWELLRLEIKEPADTV